MITEDNFVWLNMRNDIFSVKSFSSLSYGRGGGCFV